MRTVVLATLALIGAAQCAAAQMIVLVRHAERADAGMAGAPSMASDPDLSDTGRARAATLAAMLADAGVTEIFVTEYRRTRQTAEPLAKILGVTPESVPAKDLDGLVTKIKAARGNVLVVGHSNTLPPIIKRLGVEAAVAIGDDDYDNLFIVSPGARPSVLRLHFR